MKRYQVKLTGVSPLLMHADNVTWRDGIEEYRKDPRNKKASKAGDDRTPAHSWLGYVYTDGNVVGIPSDNLMTCIRDGATMIISSGKKTYKQASQTGILVDQIQWPLLIDGKSIKHDDIFYLMDEPVFSVHEEKAKKLGFELFLKSARVGLSKHIRVRPRFDAWTAEGTITVTDSEITENILSQIFDMAGKNCGLCDWRPKSKTPGTFGRFTVALKELKK